jgi:ketosteroid isomerase-like protein
MKELKELFAEKNEMVTKGQILEAVEKFFATDARTVDFNGQKGNGKQDIIAIQKQMVGMIEKVNEISLHRVGVGDDVTFAEFIIDLNFKDGTKIYWHEIIYSVWKNGKIVYEEYFKGL